MLIWALPAVLVVAACYVGPGELRRSRVDARTLLVIAVCTAAVGVAGVLWAARLPIRGFGSAYSLRHVNVEMWFTLAGAVVPSTPSRAAEVVPAALANALYVGALWLGLRRAYLRHRAQRHQETACIVLARTTPVNGAILYAPWPTYIDADALLMLSGSALLIGRAVTWAHRRLSRSHTAPCRVRHRDLVPPRSASPGPYSFAGSPRKVA